MRNRSKPVTRISDRDAALTERRNLKMARSAHAYVRGSTAKFYEWLQGGAGALLPSGPSVWICGDCHIGNLGPIANAKGHVEIEIRDLDQTVIGNPAHDLVRLGLSLASAARGSDLPGVMTAKMLEQMIDGYQAAFVDRLAAPPLDKPKAVAAALKSAMGRKWKQLAQERIRDASPSIPLGKTFWPLSKAERDAILTLFADEHMRRLVTRLRRRDDDAPIRVLDAAYWVKGCSSLGHLRYAVLVGVDGGGGEVCLMDVKEAVAPMAPRDPNAKMPRDNAERIAEGAWHLSPALGDRLLAGRLLDRSVFVRELLPQDLKFELDHLTQDEAARVARFLAHVVGRAHARQMDDETRKTWHAELNRNRSKTLDAPSWLWKSVVELLTIHEGAYLEHCRRFAQLAG
jgi:uncharacterized protein (DUF2252 family)